MEGDSSVTMTLGIRLGICRRRIPLGRQAVCMLEAWRKGLAMSRREELDFEQLVVNGIISMDSSIH